MTWPVDLNGAPITYVAEGRVWEARVVLVLTTFMVVGGPHAVTLTEANRGTVWARGWGTKEADALCVMVALS